MPNSSQIYVFDTVPALSSSVVSLILESSNLAKNVNRSFTLGLSGGSLASQLSTSSAQIKSSDTRHWRILFCDERCVPLDHADSNCGQFKDVLSEWGVSMDQVVAINQALVNDAHQAAQDYQLLLQENGEFPRLDVLLLGMGPDGHTCSLFPNHPLLNDTQLYVAGITDSPKPPLCRITLTMRALNAARNCVFVAVGASKAHVLHEMVDEHKDYPSARGILL